MIKKRVTDRFDVVYLFDPALDVFSHDEVAEYHNKGRDLSLLDLNKCAADPPTIFTCDPLKPEFQHIVDSLGGAELTLAVAWAVFKRHVKKAKNCNDEKGNPLLEWTDGAKPTIKDECQENIDNDVLLDIASVIVRKAGDIAINFTVPPTFWGIRIRSQMRRANNVEKDPVSA